MGRSPPSPPAPSASLQKFPRPFPSSTAHTPAPPHLSCHGRLKLTKINSSGPLHCPKPTPGFEVLPHQSLAQWHSHCPAPAGHTMANTSHFLLALVELHPHAATQLCPRMVWDTQRPSLHCICLSCISLLLQIMGRGLSCGSSLTTTSTALSLIT